MINMGQKIAELRKQNNMTQEELAGRINKSKQLVSLYESNKRRPPYETLEALADTFNVPMQTFLTKEEQEAALREQYDTMGIAARVDTRHTLAHKNPDSRPKSALDEVISKLIECRDAIPEGLRPDEELLIRDYRMLGARKQAMLRKWIDVLLDEDD